jgi:anti-sigma regulatory factor (Ser/Thr protein kinase)
MRNHSFGGLSPESLDRGIPGAKGGAIVGRRSFHPAPEREARPAVDVAAVSGKTALRLRLAPKAEQAFVLRAHLRLWLVQQRVAEDEVLDILLAAHEAFTNALLHAGQPRTIAVTVDGVVRDGVVEIEVGDHGHWREGNRFTAGAGLGLHLMHALMDTVDVRTGSDGTTVRLRRVLGPGVRRLETSAAPRSQRLRLAGRNTILAPLAGPPLEEVARRLIPFAADAGTTIIREGDQGELFYLIARGHVDVSARRRHVRTLGPGNHVGEIALLNGTPRSATVVAREPVELYALAREHFLTAVESDAASARAAEASVQARLDELDLLLGQVS